MSLEDGSATLVEFSAKNSLMQVCVLATERTNLILYGGLVLLGTCIPLHYEDADRQKRMMEIVSYEV